jgi:hypothetical protein
MRVRLLSALPRAYGNVRPGNQVAADEVIESRIVTAIFAATHLARSCGTVRSSAYSRLCPQLGEAA